MTILGGARQGLAAARWLFSHGAVVTINDRRPTDEMSTAQATLADTGVTWVLGSHPVGILDKTDVLCLSGGVPNDNPIMVEAIKRGIPLTNDTQIFMETVPCKTIGITGSAGKTTTTTLVGLMAKAAFGDKAYVGGNIGVPLINCVDRMKKDDLAILEISSFQLDQMTLSPNVAVILNITPNHLDRHSTMASYTAVKRRILDYQSADDIAILSRDDLVAWSLHEDVRGRLISFGSSPLKDKQNGTCLHDGFLHVHMNGVNIPLLQQEKILLRGRHNVLNVLAAFAIGFAAGFPLDAMRTSVEEFRGVAHRLEFVREWKGAAWYNDSIATTPERTIAAIHSFSEPIVLLLGGRDKNLPWDELVALIHERADHIVLFGEAAEKIMAKLGMQIPGQRPYSLERYSGLKEAVRAAALVASHGDVVLLSPGGTSFDEFTDFEARGEAFHKWVLELS